MKKMITLLATVMVAGFVSAAAVTWNTQSLAALENFASDWNGQTVSFFLVDSEFNLSAVVTGLSTEGQTIAEMGATMGTLDLTHSTWAKGSNVSSVGADSSFNPREFVYGYAVLYNADGSKVAISSIGSAEVPDVGNVALGLGGATNFGVYDVVPEPTSLALLGLGVAALGLRRRFKK